MGATLVDYGLVFINLSGVRWGVLDEWQHRGMDQIDSLAALRSLAELVREHYLYPDRADDLADQIQAWATSEIAAMRSAELLGSALTDSLREATGDLHFKVIPRVFTPEELAAPPEDRWKHFMPGAASNFGFRSVEVNDATALLRLTSLDHIKWSRPTAIATMNFARHAERVLIDVRGCQGGDPELIEHLAGYFLGPAPIELSTVQWRDGKTETCHSDPDGAAFQFDPDVALVVVVGPETASGGEALADHLQAPGRATVVGQPSIGAAHRIKEFQLLDGLVARIPSGFVVNTFTGTDWEGRGVVPDVQVEPGADAIQVAAAAAVGHRAPDNTTTR